MSVKDFLNSFKNMAWTVFLLLNALPVMMFNFFVTTINSMVGVLTYHIFSFPPKPFHDEVALILGYDNPLGRAFATEIVKMRGTVVLLDNDEERGEEFAKKLVKLAANDRAIYRECDLTNVESVTKVLKALASELDVSILLNCSAEHPVSTYYNAYREVFSIMKEKCMKTKGRLVFIRTSNAENRNAIQSLHEGINKELKADNEQNVTTILAHIYPIITEGNEKNVFGSISPKGVADKVLEDISKNRREVFVPEYMIYLSWWLKFTPTGFATLIDNYFFGDK